MSIFISYARKPQAFKPGDEWHPFEASQVKPGEAEQFPAWSGYGKISDGVTYKTPIAVPSGVDSQIPKEGTARQNSRPPEAVAVWGMQDE